MCKIAFESEHLSVSDSQFKAKSTQYTPWNYGNINNNNSYFPKIIWMESGDKHICYIFLLFFIKILQVFTSPHYSELRENLIFCLENVTFLKVYKTKLFLNLF